jgi:transcriptional regulator with XRE-family HTH domain
MKKRRSFFGYYVWKTRKQHNVSLKKFCETVGYSPSQWARIEFGELKPPRDMEKYDDIVFGMKLHPQLAYTLYQMSFGCMPEKYFETGFQDFLLNILTLYEKGILTDDVIAQIGQVLAMAIK